MAKFPAGDAEEQPLFLSSLPPNSTHKRLAFAVVLALLAAFFITAGFVSSIQLPRVAAFVPAYATAMFLCDSISALLLFAQFAIVRSRALLVIANGYLFTALILIPWMLTFPGIFSPGGLLGAGLQTTTYLYILWHTGFPLFVIAYGLLNDPDPSRQLDQDSRRPAILSGIAVIAGVCAATSIVIASDTLLPVLMLDVVQPSHLVGIYLRVTGMFSVVALIVLWVRRRSVLDLWLMVVLCAWLCEVALAVMLNAGRFDLGFYAGRIFGFAATSVVLAVLLLETRALYARLAQSLEAERTILQHANEMLERRVAERSRQLEAEIAEREKAQKTLREAQKLEAVGRMAGGIAHDFNNLLTVVRGNAELLRTSPQSDDDMRSIESIDRAADRGSRLVRQILTFSRRQPLKSEVVDLRLRAEELSEMLGRTVRGDVRLLVSLAEDLWPIECDVAELEIALMNLCVNARDAMPRGGLVRVEGRNCTLPAAGVDASGLAGDFVALSVVDSGTGVAPENMDKVFEPFFTTKEVGKGTGLGLSQVYGFAQQSGGMATLESELGKGTSVTIYLPRAAREPARQGTSARARRPRATGAVLLVEDDDDVADVARGILRLIGYGVDHVRDGGTALALLASGQRFDIVFSDIILPGGMSGLELARKVRQHFPGMPILLSSGYARATGDVHREGFDIIAKPYGADSLGEALRRTVAAAERAALASRDTA